MTLLVTSIAPKNLAELKGRAERAWVGGAGAVELRLDAYDEDPVALARYLADHRDRTWIATCRSIDQGGQSSADPLERAEFLIAATCAGGALIDFEYADWQRFETAREALSHASASVPRDGPCFILSVHDFAGLPENIRDTVSAIRGVQPATVAKIAYGIRDICDSFAALDLMHEHGAGVVAIALGEAGLWSRVLAKKLGAFGTYCSLDATSATAPGQLALGAMIHRYRWPRITGSTKVYGVIGDPVLHSLSPLVFNRWFTDEGIDAVYLPLLVCNEAGCLEGFLEDCRQRPWLDLGGFSVTLPHKQAALRWAGSGADAAAVAVGALNTLVMRRGKIEGFNTDAPAAAASLEAALSCGPRELAGLPVDVLGTGGVARAVLAGLRGARCR
ncbi:MAG: type I 3-dehydroquinate dehydratase, partial [Planctomycetes bacterium]|nr:type I 3-dehydroquinate dehydratase [Planctomycetota bacterium]